MSHRYTTWRIHGGGDSGGESDEETMVENLTPPKGVTESFCQCVDAIKWKLYDATVMGPELKAPEVQQNKLLETYEGYLEQLYVLLNEALKGFIKESLLVRFPSELRHEILKCAQEIQRMSRAGTALRYTECIPYRDYLHTQLRVYPYLQNRGKDADE
jgi:hypothetical protein